MRLRSFGRSRSSNIQCDSIWIPALRWGQSYSIRGLRRGEQWPGSELVCLDRNFPKLICQSGVWKMPYQFRRNFRYGVDEGANWLIATAVCDFDEVVVGGGCYDDGVGTAGAQNDNGPMSNGWYCSSVDHNRPQHRTLRSVAICVEQ